MRSSVFISLDVYYKLIFASSSPEKTKALFFSKISNGKIANLENDQVDLIIKIILLSGQFLCD